MGDPKLDVENVGGWTREGKSLTRKLEDKIYDRVVTWVPKFIHPNWFTLSSPFLSAGIIAGALLVRRQPLFLWATPILVFTHYVADCLDGKLGRVRKTGYILWGFFMDHVLDFVFNAAMIIALMINFPQDRLILSLAIILIGGNMLTEALRSATLGTYKIYGEFGFGSTEGTFSIIFLTAFLAAARPERMSWVIWIIYFFLTLVWIKNIYLIQKTLSKTDMANKAAKQPSTSPPSPPASSQPSARPDTS